MSYKPQTQIDIENSPLYAVRHWRNTPEETESTLEDFLFWLEYDREGDGDSEAIEANLPSIKALVDEYLGRDMSKIKAGENELLKQWTQATKG